MTVTDCAEAHEQDIHTAQRCHDWTLRVFTSVLDNIIFALESWEMACIPQVPTDLDNLRQLIENSRAAPVTAITIATLEQAFVDAKMMPPRFFDAINHFVYKIDSDELEDMSSEEKEEHIDAIAMEAGDDFKRSWLRGIEQNKKAEKQRAVSLGLLIASVATRQPELTEPELEDSFHVPEEGVFPKPRSVMATLDQLERERDEARAVAAADALEMLTKIDRLEKALAIAKAPPFSTSSPAKALAPKAKMVLQDRTNA